MAKSQYKIFDYKITTDPSFMNKQFGITPEIAEILQEIYPRILEEKSGIIKELKRLCLQYPKVPQFKNYLSVAYSVAGKYKLAYAVNERILKEHPDYLFGKLNLAAEYLQEGRPEKVPNILGNLMELKDLYPERDTFHLIEVLTFNKLAVRYFLDVDNPEIAENRLELMQELAPDNPETVSARKFIMSYNLEKAAERIDEEDKYSRVVKSRDYDKTVQTDEKPKFTHPEMEALYVNGMRIDPVILKQILALPRETLIKDLEIVLQDAINRFEYFRDKNEQENNWNEKENNFPLHALFLLAELKAEESLPSVLNLLRQGEELLEFWFSDFLTEMLWEVIYCIGQNKLADLGKFIKEPDNHTFARNMISSGVVQIALYHPKRKAEIIDWYADLFEFFIQNTENDRIIDTELISFMVWDCLNLRAKQLTAIIEKLYSENLVEPGIIGTLEEVQHDIRSASDERDKRKRFDIFSRYKYVVTTWYYYTEGKDIYPNREEKFIPFPEENNSVLPPLNKDFHKVGRNDPCPCGSGKKFKRCCMNKN